MPAILAVSASPAGEKIALLAGADSFLAKPFDIRELLIELKRLANTGRVS